MNRNALRGEIARNGLTQRDVAKHLEMSEKTFSVKIRTGTFGLDDARKMIVLLGITDPVSIFFTPEETSQVTSINKSV